MAPLSEIFCMASISLVVAKMRIIRISRGIFSFARYT